MDDVELPNGSPNKTLRYSAGIREEREARAVPLVVHRIKLLRCRIQAKLDFTLKISNKRAPAHLKSLIRH